MHQTPALGTYDLAVIGGGLTGAGVLRDAALRGLTCILFEQADFASGSISKTPRLLHGGFLYLEQRRLRMVMACLRERDLLLEQAGHLLRPLPVVLPIYRSGVRKLWKLRVALRLYDAIGMGNLGQTHRVLSRRQAQDLAPDLPADGLEGAGLLHDHLLPMPERLVFENLLSAQEHGARCLNYHEVLRVGEEADGLDIEVRDVLGGRVLGCRAKMAVNTTGPWADLTLSRFTPGLPPRLCPTKGVHVAVPGTRDYALFSEPAGDGRLRFSVPLPGFTLVGATSSPWAGDPAGCVAEPRDVAALLEGVGHAWPGGSAALWAYAGVRPLAGQPAAGGRILLDPHHVLYRDGDGGRFLTLAGGKLATYRRTAEEIVDEVCLGLGVSTESRTDRTPLYGGGTGDRTVFRENLCECTERIPNLPRQTVEHLVGLYGRKCCRVLDLALANPGWEQPIAPGYRDFRAQVVYAVRTEHAHCLEDVILRRLSTVLSADRGTAAARPVAEVMGEELGWDASRVREEVERFQDLVGREVLHGRPGGGP